MEISFLRLTFKGRIGQCSESQFFFLAKELLFSADSRGDLVSRKARRHVSNNCLKADHLSGYRLLQRLTVVFLFLYIFRSVFFLMNQIGDSRFIIPLRVFCATD